MEFSTKFILLWRAFNESQQSQLSFGEPAFGKVSENLLFLLMASLRLSSPKRINFRFLRSKNMTLQAKPSWIPKGVAYKERERVIHAGGWWGQQPWRQLRWQQDKRQQKLIRRQWQINWNLHKVRQCRELTISQVPPAAAPVQFLSWTCVLKSINTYWGIFWGRTGYFERSISGAPWFDDQDYDEEEEDRVAVVKGLAF